MSDQPACDNSEPLGLANTVEPIWIPEDPQGEDPAHWRQISRDAIACILVEDA